MGSRADRLNRVLLSLLAVVLLATGIAGLLFGLGAFGQDRANSLVLSRDVVQFVPEQARWFWPLVAVLLVLLALLALRWLLQQLRTDRLGDLDLTEHRNRGETHVDAAAVTEALVDATQRCPGVDSAAARIVRVRHRDRLVLHVRLADRADIAEVRRQLATGPLTDLRHVLGEATCPDLSVELEPSNRGSSRSVA